MLQNSVEMIAEEEKTRTKEKKVVVMGMIVKQIGGKGRRARRNKQPAAAETLFTT